MQVVHPASTASAYHGEALYSWAEEHDILDGTLNVNLM